MAAKKKQPKSSPAPPEPRIPKKPASGKGLNLNLSPKLKEEIAGLLLMAFSVLMIVAVVTHRVDENPDSILTLWRLGELKNLLGVVGAYLSYYFVFYTFGYAFVAVPVLLLVYGWLVFVHRSIFLVNAFAFYILTLMVLVSGWIALPDAGQPTAIWTSCGLLGGMIAHQLFVWMGRFGCMALWVVLSLVWLIMVTRISIADLVPAIQNIFVASFRRTAHAMSRFKSWQSELLEKETNAIDVAERPLIPEYLRPANETGNVVDKPVVQDSSVKSFDDTPKPVVVEPPVVANVQSGVSEKPSQVGKSAAIPVTIPEVKAAERPRFINAEPLTEEDIRIADRLQKEQTERKARTTEKVEKPSGVSDLTGSIQFDTQLVRDIESLRRIDREFTIPSLDTDEVKPASGTIIPTVGVSEVTPVMPTAEEAATIDAGGSELASIARQGFEQELGDFEIPEEESEPETSRASTTRRHEKRSSGDFADSADTEEVPEEPAEEKSLAAEEILDVPGTMSEAADEKPVPKRRVTKPVEVKDEEIDFDRENQVALRKYRAPSLDLLEPTQEAEKLTPDEIADLDEKIAQIIKTMQEFGIDTKVVATEYSGPVVAIYQLELPSGLKISKVTGLEDELALAMKVKSVRMVPVTSKGTIQVEIPKPKASPVLIRSLFEDRSFKVAKSKYRLGLALGKTIDGAIHFEDLAKMPHLLIAGTTGSGKSVGVNSMITSLLYQFDPSEVKFIMIDPKKVELALYRRLKNHHLICLRNQRGELIEDVITKPENAKLMLKALVDEMEQRYEKLAHANVRNIEDYNKRWAENDMPGDANYQHHKLEYIVAIIDELADLMMTAPREIETSITRLAQMARAVGIHLVVATQRPSVDVLTGLIKANFPARIAYQVRSKIDSRTILDMSGAEQLLGKGDMLYLPPGAMPIRIQNAFTSTRETETIVEYIADMPAFPRRDFLIREEQREDMDGESDAGQYDPLFNQALEIVVKHNQGSASLLQRRLSVGYARAARIVDQLERAGIVSAQDGGKARQVLITEDQLEAYKV